MVLFPFLAAQRMWFNLVVGLLRAYVSFPIAGCFAVLVRSEFVAALAEWFNPLVWLLNCLVSVAGCGCSAPLFQI